MADDLRSARPDMSAADAAGLMSSHDIGIVPLVDEAGRPAGVVTDRDIVVRVIAARTDPREVRLGDIATTQDLRTISPDASLAEALHRMEANRIKRLLVVKDQQLVGVISLGDVAQGLASARSVGEAVGAIFSTSAGDRLRASDGLAPDPGTPERVLEARRNAPSRDQADAADD
jgi:signal-transduction protein with cAMP-binding, CBS, and nucleotidyltransferase domain